MKLKNLKKQYKKNKKRLSKFLDKFDDNYVPGLDAEVAKIDKKIWKKTDCLECGNCCSKMSPTFTEEDIVRISTHLNYSPAEFREKYLEEDDSGDWINTNVPCQFLGDDLKCSIYEIRPIDCAKFPHHHETPFDEYNDLFKQNMKYCPATLSLVKKVKKYVDANYDW